jgi:uncharacterized protein
MTTVLVFLAALLGHAALWVALVNRVHAVGLSRRCVRLITVLCFFCLPAMPLAAVAWIILAGVGPLDAFGPGHWQQPVSLGVLLYLAVCWMAAAVTLPRWVRRHVFHRPPRVLRWHRTRSILAGRACLPGRPASPEAPPLPIDEHPHHFLVHVPGNQILRLDLSERAIDVPRLPPELDGLSVVHLSDLHFTGRVGKTYFQEVVRLSNKIEPELVLVTGDLVDDSRYIDWVPDTLGCLRARYGVYFVLGNHDLRADTSRLRGVLREQGLIYVGARWLEVEVRGQRVVLAGNELPWIGPAADLSDCPPREVAPLRILLAHTPDRLDWARRWDADLLLAGHTHGGQIRLPGIGPIFAPSSSGVKHSSGLFYDPPTILHVTRGVSGELPIRLNCPPELVHLVLHSPSANRRE